MNQRPASVTVISLLIIAVSVIGLFFGFLGYIGLSHKIARAYVDHPNLMTHAPLMAYAITMGLMYIVCAIFLLRGKRWARNLYVALGLISIIVSLVLKSHLGSILFTLIFFLIVVFFLFRPNASAFFKNGHGNNKT